MDGLAGIMDVVVGNGVVSGKQTALAAHAIFQPQPQPSEIPVYVV